MAGVIKTDVTLLLLFATFEGICFFLRNANEYNSMLYRILPAHLGRHIVFALCPLKMYDGDTVIFGVFFHSLDKVLGYLFQ